MEIEERRNKKIHVKECGTNKCENEYLTEIIITTIRTGKKGVLDYIQFSYSIEANFPFLQYYFL